MLLQVTLNLSEQCIDKNLLLFGTIFRHVVLLVTEILRQDQNFQNIPCIIIFFSSDVYLKDLTYQTIYINGEIDGVKDLHIGSGVNVQLGEMVKILNIYKLKNKSFKILRKRNKQVLRMFTLWYNSSTEDT